MTDLSTTLANIDSVTSPTCAVCPRPLSGSPSDDFCSPACQHVWHQARADAKAVEDLRRPDPYGYTDGNTYCDDEDCEVCPPPRRPVPARIAAAGRNGGYLTVAEAVAEVARMCAANTERLEASLNGVNIERARLAYEAEGWRISGCTGQPDCAGCADPVAGHGSGQPMGILNVDTSAGILAEAIGLHLTRSTGLPVYLGDGSMTFTLHCEDRATPILQRLADRVRSITQWPL